jgi:hypothetical protein
LRHNNFLFHGRFSPGSPEIRHLAVRRKIEKDYKCG